MIGFGVLLGLVVAVAGRVAAVAGFGIGSLLTPALGSQVGLKLAVAAISIPHVAGTGLRFWRLRQDIDHGVFWSFGITSTVGGLLGALLHGFAAFTCLRPASRPDDGDCFPCG